MEKIVRKERLIPGPLQDVWNAWTTSDGATTFFAPKAKIELRLGGAYELYFNLDEKEGRKGSEGMHVLSFVPGEMLSFEWNSPPEFSVRSERGMWVTVFLEQAHGWNTRVRLVHLGFGNGEEWDRVHAYFDRVWDVVLRRLEHRFQKGPVDWRWPPT
ncbi:MAG: SRPBCC domain-containing protein [Myxococcota bacterium]